MWVELFISHLESFTRSADRPDTMHMGMCGCAAHVTRNSRYCERAQSLSSGTKCTRAGWESQCVDQGPAWQQFWESRLADRIWEFTDPDLH